MKRKVIIALAYIAIVAVCYWLTCYVNIILGVIAIVLGYNIFDKVFMKGTE
jgi:hypothetical protein